MKELLIKNGVNERNIVVPRLTKFQEYDYEISRSLFVVSMRYHGCVLASKNFIPFYTFQYIHLE